LINGGKRVPLVLYGDRSEYIPDKNPGMMITDLVEIPYWIGDNDRTLRQLNPWLSVDIKKRLKFQPLFCDQELVNVIPEFCPTNSFAVPEFGKERKAS
jgi:hypothetical protein